MGNFKQGPEKIRFDVELTDEEMKKFEEICKKCYRSRKNFAEALIKLIINTRGNLVDLSKLGDI